MEKDNETRIKLEKWMSGARKRTGLQAFYAVKVGPKGGLTALYQGTSDACTGQIKTNPNIWTEGKADYFCMPYNGETPADRGSGGTRSLGYDPIEFKGGKVSRAWLDFICDPNGYWKQVLPFIVNLDDLDLINESTGFIFETPHFVPSEATFNFLIATRWPQEQNRRAVIWYDLVTKGVDPAIAFIYANWYMADGRLQSTPHHTIGFSPPKIWAKDFFMRNPKVCENKAGKINSDRVSLFVHSTHPIGLQGTEGENKWFIKNAEHTGSPLTAFFGTDKGGRIKPGNTQGSIIEEITTFVSE